MKALSIVTGIVSGTLLTGWIGLRIKPRPFPPYPEPTPGLQTAPFPQNLPDPVARYFRSSIGDAVPLITSAVLTGSIDLRINHIPLRGRFRIIHQAGMGYRHYLEATFFGYPVLKVNEWYLDQVARLELPFGVVDNEPKVNLAANLGMWAESVWLPSILITDPRVRWEAIDEVSARLVVPSPPFGDSVEDVLHVSFDPHTGLLRSLDGMRYKEAGHEEKTGWHNEVLDWRSFHGIRVPSPATVTWADEGIPWSMWNIEDIAYNVDVSASIRQSGL